MDSEQLLAWCQQQTRGYKGVSINDLDHSWKDGLALCALIHSLEGKNGKDYEAFVSLPASAVLSDTFQLAEKLGIPPLLQYLESSDLLDTVPNSTLVESYLQFVYQHWQQHQHTHPNNQQQKENNSESNSEHTNGDSKEQVAEAEAEADQDLALLTDHVGKTLRESKEIKGMLVTVEAELTKIHQNIEQHDKHKELVMNQISEKTLQLDTSLEKERLQYDKEIERLEKELEELKKKGPSDQQLALKRKLDEQLEKKDKLTKLKKQMEEDVEQLKEQLANDERKRAELQEKRVQAEQKRGDLRQKHKEELQRLQRDLYDNFRAEDQVHTDLLQRKAVNTALTMKNLDGISTRLTKQNSDLMEKKRKLGNQLLSAKLYLEEEQKTLNFKEISQSDLQQLRTMKAQEREMTYETKRKKDKIHREVTAELAETKDMYDKEHRLLGNVRRDVTNLEIQRKVIKGDSEQEKQRRNKKVKQLKELDKAKLDKEQIKHKAKVDNMTSQIAVLSTNTEDAHAALTAEKAKIAENRALSDGLIAEAKAASLSLDKELHSQAEANSAQDALSKALQSASDFLEDKHSKRKAVKAKHQRAEDSLKSVAEQIAQNDAKKAELENNKDHLSREHELTKQDAKLMEKDTNKVKEDKQKLLQEKAKLKHDITMETERSRTRKSQATSEQHEKLKEELSEMRSLIDSIERDTRKLHSKADQLKGEGFGLANSLVGITQTQHSQEQTQQNRLQDKQELQRLLDMLSSLQGRLQANELMQESGSEGEIGGDQLALQVEADVLKRRKDEVEALVRAQINKLQ